MDKINAFLLQSKPRLYLICGILLSVFAKLIEFKFPNFAMGLQLIAFILIIISIKKYLSKTNKV